MARKLNVAPSQARGLKHIMPSGWETTYIVAPSQARGLKQFSVDAKSSLGGRAFTGAWIETDQKRKRMRS